MAHIDYVEDRYDAYDQGSGMAEAAPARGTRLGALVNWAGALMSLGIMVGMGVWAVQLMVRDVSGVPVIEAMEGPMRQPPADPGGTQAPHQGLAVGLFHVGGPKKFRNTKNAVVSTWFKQPFSGYPR